MHSLSVCRDPVIDIMEDRHLRDLMIMIPAILLCLVPSAITWLLDDIACPATQCQCGNGVIHCDRRQLSFFPDFNASRFPLHTLDYGYNHVTHVPAAAFSSLDIIRLYLNNNNITSIAYAAFKGLYKTLVVLNLRNNRLKTLPPAIARLQSITEVDVTGNHLDGYRVDAATHHHADDFTDWVLREIGDTLRKFSFGDETSLGHWPHSIRHLPLLVELSIVGSRIPILPQNAFNSTNLLQRLTIKSSNLVQIPIAIRVLHGLQELSFDGNTGGNGNNVLIEQPFHGVARNLVTLSLRSDGLNEFPHEIQYLTMLSNLTLNNNNLLYISDESIGLLKGTNISVLNLRNCSLFRIPSSLSVLRTLTELDFSANHIRTVEKYDLRTLRRLRKLSLAENPIIYIASSSFYRLDNLVELDLTGSNITEIPGALANLFNLRILDLRWTNTQCTCELYWLKRWIVQYRRHITIYGQCENIDQSLMNYVNKRIPTCPDYNDNLK